MKIYLIVSHAVFNFEDCDICTQAFFDKEKAQEVFKKIVEEEREWAKKNNLVIDFDDEDYFMACAERDYACTHTLQELREIEVE